MLDGNASKAAELSAKDAELSVKDAGLNDALLKLGAAQKLVAELEVRAQASSDSVQQLAAEKAQAVLAANQRAAEAEAKLKLIADTPSRPGARRRNCLCARLRRLLAITAKSQCASGLPPSRRSFV